MRNITTRLSSLFLLVRPLMLTFAGIVLLSLGVTSLFIWAYRSVTMPEFFSYLILQFMPGPTRGILLLLLGGGVLAIGMWKLSGVVVFRLQGTLANNELILGYRHPRKLPRVVVLSGGAGMLIQANIADSVERLTCITPVQDAVEYYYRASSLFQEQHAYYVVPTPTAAKVYAELDDGTVKNVMRVNHDPLLEERYVVRLMLIPEHEIAGIVGGDEQVAAYLAQKNADSTEPLTGNYPLTRLAREALREADAIIFGPGSLFESVLPNLLIDDLRLTIQESSARKIYICNLMTETGLTTGFSVADHIRQFKRYGGFSPDYVLVNVHRIDPDVRQLYVAAHQAPVTLSPEDYEETAVLTQEGVVKRRVVVEDSVVIEADLASSVIQYSASLDNPAERRAVRVLRHDHQKLKAAIMELLRWE